MKYQQHLEQCRLALAQSDTKLPFPLKLKMAELMLNLMRRRKHFGMFVILGWKAQWQRYADTPDASQDIFAHRHVNIMKVIPRKQKRDGVVSTIKFDGAILVNGRGDVLRSGVMIEGLRPRATAQKVNPGRATDLSTQFGFREKVHMRHIAAITSSYLFHGTTVFTISEETNAFHVFEEGRIIYSTVHGELQDGR